ncbi:linker for activation of T-cells family member 2 isoform X1 [Ornithorhynchus anatinus]|uniref:linker for activation of T-cells family member 2 isoform X1 n=1 Tax=Ornithorhynchus anatinus TaxID=9258 RepID=UPI0010A77DF7|nr:linker for activation of T-cells family member 2 isoform X1 [Ornithorhynchus anatinus]XP_028937573.1 linker for activation of T-cells family member 2 isoform X1 [Ornithorhynchus anatinus]
MSPAELLLAGASLLLVGALAGLCVCCSRPGQKKQKKVYQQRTLPPDHEHQSPGSAPQSVQLGTLSPTAAPGPLEEPCAGCPSGRPPSRREEHQSFTVMRAYSTVAALRPGLMDTQEIPTGNRKGEELCTASAVEDAAEPRYQNFRKKTGRESETSYVDPIASDYYNCEGLRQQPPDEDDDSNSYENVLICQGRSSDLGLEDLDDYQNLLPRETSGSPGDDSSEPDYVNEPAAATGRGGPRVK